MGEDRPTFSKAYLGGTWSDCAFREEKDLAPRFRLSGPLVIEGETSTTYIPSDWSASLDEACNLIARRAK
jgi:N-methylhydantoinase A